MANRPKVLLTGATGFIGSHVMEALFRAGLPVVVMARPRSDLQLARSLGVEVRYADLRQPASLAAALKGCSQVIHTAALASDWGHARDFHSVNVEGTLNLLRACIQEGVQHVIVTGSISSYGEEHCPANKDESSGYNSHYPYFLDRVFPCALNHYRDSKAEMTRQSLRFAEEHGMDLTVIEPVWVYGEREFNTGFFSYVRAVQRGTAWMPGSLTNSFHVIYAPDLAKAYVLAASKHLPGAERIIVGNPAPAPMHEIFDRFCTEAGLRPPHRLPKWTMYPVGIGLEMAHRVFQRQHPPILTRGRVNMFYDSIQYSTEKATRLLGFECDHSLAEGIRNTVAWYKTHQLL